jgi:hypothetical protein
MIKPSVLIITDVLLALTQQYRIKVDSDIARWVALTKHDLVSFTNKLTSKTQNNGSKFFININLNQKPEIISLKTLNKPTKPVPI